MDVVYERCAGIDISKADVKVCIRVPGRGKGTRRRGEVRTFPALTSGLLEMRDWLLAEGVTVVGMEATGSYWKPVFYLIFVSAARAPRRTGRPLTRSHNWQDPISHIRPSRAT
ncbi:hypothetical protein [Streptomyces sp. NPDC006668]|uniref:hypothetical protein n=1 Tax=Streptomyces sp. NPDC006668 TaxID=3156903 RepID=UPI0033BFDCA6